AAAACAAHSRAGVRRGPPAAKQLGFRWRSIRATRSTHPPNYRSRPRDVSTTIEQWLPSILVRPVVGTRMLPMHHVSSALMLSSSRNQNETRIDRERIGQRTAIRLLLRRKLALSGSAAPRTLRYMRAQLYWRFEPISLVNGASDRQSRQWLFH